MKSELLFQLCQALREIDIEPKTININIFHSSKEDEIHRLIYFCHYINSLNEFEKKTYSMILKVTMMLINEKEMSELLNDFDSMQVNSIDGNEEIHAIRKVR